MTGQPLFASHVPRLAETIVRLVNAVTPGEDGGRPHAVPAGADLRLAVAAALGASSVTDADASHLAVLAGRARLAVEAAGRADLDAAGVIANDLLRETGARPQLDRAEDGGLTLHFHGPDDSIALGWGAGIAAGLAMALGSELAGRLGVCEAPRCDRTYVDLSRNGARRFCSTRCQSRVKAAAHRERTRP